MTLMFPVGIVQKSLLGFHRPRALCSFSLHALQSLKQDSAFFTPSCCVLNNAFAFPWRQGCELSDCALSHERRNGLKSPVIAGGSRQRRKRADGRMFVHVLRVMYCIMSVLSARLSQSQLHHRSRWHRRLAASQFCVSVQQDGDKNQTLLRAKKVAKQSEGKSFPRNTVWVYCPKNIENIFLFCSWLFWHWA